MAESDYTHQDVILNGSSGRLETVTKSVFSGNRHLELQDEKPLSHTNDKIKPDRAINDVGVSAHGDEGTASRSHEGGLDSQTGDDALNGVAVCPAECCTQKMARIGITDGPPRVAGPGLGLPSRGLMRSRGSESSLLALESSGPVVRFLDAAVTYLQADRGVRVAHCRVRQALMDGAYRLGLTQYRVQGVGGRYEGFPGEVCAGSDTLETSRDYPVVVWGAVPDEGRYKFGTVEAVRADAGAGWVRLRAAQQDLPRFVCTEHGGESYLNSQAFLHRAAPGTAARDRNTSSRNSANCLSCPAWPPCAREFLTRPRPHGWPSASLLDKVKHGGCHVDAGGCNDKETRDIEWRWSFSVSERLLIHDLPDDLAGVLMTLKAITKIVTGGHFSRTSFPEWYCIKTACFWVFETVPQGKGTNSTMTICMSVIDWLLEAYQAGVVPHYFIPDHNIIGFLTSEEVDDVYNHVLRVREDIWRLTLKALDVTSHLPGLAREISSVIRKKGTKNDDVIINHMMSAKRGVADILGRATEFIKDTGDAYKLKKQLAFCLWADGNFHLEMFDIIFSQHDIGMPLSDVINVPDYVIRPILSDLAGQGEIGAYYRSVLYRFLGDVYHHLTFLIKNNNVSDDVIDDRVTSLLHECQERCMSSFTSGLELVYPGGWGDGGLGGRVLLAKHYFLLQDWEGLKGVLPTLEPLLYPSLQDAEMLNSLPRVNVWKPADRHGGIFPLQGLVSSPEQERGSFVAFHPVSLGLYILQRSRELSLSKVAAFLTSGLIQRDDNLTQNCDNARSRVLYGLKQCEHKLWDQTLVSTTAYLLQVLNDQK